MIPKAFRLVYHSEMAIPGGPETVGQEIDRILASSRKNNAAAGVTGALMFNRGLFAQVLEGDGPKVETAFERIQQDGRHRNLVVLEFAPVRERGFSRWSMAFVGGSRGDRARFGHLAHDSGFDPSDFDADGLYQLLRDTLLEDENILSAEG